MNTGTLIAIKASTEIFRLIFILGMFAIGWSVVYGVLGIIFKVTLKKERKDFSLGIHIFIWLFSLLGGAIASGGILYYILVV